MSTSRLFNKVLRDKLKQSGKITKKGKDRKVSMKEAREYREYLQSSRQLGKLIKINKKTGAQKSLSKKASDKVIQKALMKNKKLTRILRSGIPQQTHKQISNAKNKGIYLRPSGQSKKDGKLVFKIEKGRLAGYTVTTKAIKNDIGEVTKIRTLTKEKLRGNMFVNYGHIKAEQVKNWLDKEAKKLGANNYMELSESDKKRVQQKKKAWITKNFAKSQFKYKRKKMSDWERDQNNNFCYYPEEEADEEDWLKKKLLTMSSVGIV